MDLIWSDANGRLESAETPEKPVLFRLAGVLCGRGIRVQDLHSAGFDADLWNPMERLLSRFSTFVCRRDIVYQATGLHCTLTGTKSVLHPTRQRIF
jgi:hypothetical protein